MPYKIPPQNYSVWIGLKQRCLNPMNSHFRYYGGRGIKVCDRWKKSYKDFMDDMGNRPKGYEIDRINNNGDYCPENCRWVTHKENLRNRRITKKVIIEGKSYLAIALSETYGIKSDTIIERVNAGLSFKDVISKNRRYNFDGLALGGKASGKIQQAKTHCPKGHEYSPQNTSVNSNGWRRCKTCHRDKETQRRHALHHS